MDLVLIYEETGAMLDDIQQQIDAYNIHDVYESIFEEKTASVNTQLVRNNKSKESGGILNGIGKVVEKILTTIKNIIESVVNFIQVLTLSGKDKEQYEAFVKKCSEHPKLKNQKITVADYRKYYGDYKKLLDEVKRAEKSILAGNKDPDLETIENKVKSFITGGIGGAVTAVGVGVALRMAASSKDIAAMINKDLKENPEHMDMLRGAIGDKQANKFAKDVKGMTHFINAKRIWMMLTGSASRSVEESAKKTFTDAANAVNAVKDLGMPEYDPNHNILVNTAKKVGHVIMHPVKSAKVVKGYLQNKDTIDAAMGNKQIKDAVKGAKTFVDNKHDAERGNVLAKRGIVGKQSALASAAGFNDPNSLTSKIVAKNEKRKKDEEDEFLNY